MRQDGLGAGQGAKLGGGQKALGGVLESMQDSVEARGAIFDAGQLVEGQKAGMGLIVSGQAGQGSAGGGKDGDDKVKERIAAAGSGGLDVLREGFENRHRGKGLDLGLRWRLGLGCGLSHGNSPNYFLQRDEITKSSIIKS